MRPHPLIIRSYFFRGATVWLVTRALVTALLLRGFHPFGLSFAAVVLVVIISAVLCLIETFRNKESTLLGNLGVSRFTLILLFVAPAVVGEASIAVAGRFGS